LSLLFLSFLLGFSYSISFSFGGGLGSSGFVISLEFSSFLFILIFLVLGGLFLSVFFGLHLSVIFGPFFFQLFIKNFVLFSFSLFAGFCCLS